ncbi:hypothetical protein GCM10010531_31730 [Blastococcus jejuensis]|uniref:Uncharacterized protein n=1 Tax=Blastococcus jejuensis TaxID=351224 RepID=A0ABP6PDT4_9ACTN
MEPTAATPTSAEPACAGDGTGDRTADWSWPPYAPLEPAEVPRFCIEEWAPASTVRRPWVRVGRWTLLYRRAA